jgi:hypothetical protein
VSGEVPGGALYGVDEALAAGDGHARWMRAWRSPGSQG